LISEVRRITGDTKAFRLPEWTAVTPSSNFFLRVLMGCTCGTTIPRLLLALLLFWQMELFADNGKGNSSGHQ
jgi:hypothetical protein